MKEEFDSKEQILINKLKEFGKEIKPSQTAFERMLAALSKKAVTNSDSARYNYSMWKYAVVAVLIALVAGLAFVKYGRFSPTNQNQVGQTEQVPNQPLTASNADSTFDQTDQAIVVTTSQMDQDLQALDQNGESSENDVSDI